MLLKSTKINILQEADQIYINELKSLIEDGILKLQKINSDQRSALYIFTVLLNNSLDL